MSNLSLTGSLTSTPDGVKVLTGADTTGTTDSSASFQSAALAVAATGGVIFVRRGSYIAEGIPLDTGSPNFYPITWIGEGVDICVINLPSSPTEAMFSTAQTVDIPGGGVIGFTLIGDAQSGTGEATDPTSLKSGTQDCIDLSSAAQAFEFLVDGCFIKNFRYGWVGADSSRSPVFGTNNFRYNEIAIYNKNDHPLFSGVNDIRANYIGLGGDIWFDCMIPNQKINYNHYGIKCTRIEKSSIANSFFFKNKKVGVLINGDRTNVRDAPGMVPPDALTISTLTYATTILTITTSAAHSLEVGDRIWAWDIGGLTPDPNELSGASELTVASVVDSDTFTTDAGGTVSGTWDTNGQLTPYAAHVEITFRGSKVKGNIIRESADSGRCGAGDIYVNSTGSILDCGIDSNECYGSGTSAPNLKRIFLAINCGSGGTNEFRINSVTGNTLSEYDQAIRRINGRIEQTNCSGNTCQLGVNGPGSGNSFFELNLSTFGNIVNNNVVAETGASSTVAGDYIYDIDASRGIFTGNYVRYDESQWTAGLLVAGVSAETVPAGMTNGTSTGSTDTANAKTDNSITSF